MASTLTDRQAAEAIEQFGDDLKRLIAAFDEKCRRMPAWATDAVNSVKGQDDLDDIARGFRDVGSTLCEQADAAEEAETYRLANPLQPGFRRIG